MAYNKTTQLMFTSSLNRLLMGFHFLPLALCVGCRFLALIPLSLMKMATATVGFISWF